MSNAWKVAVGSLVGAIIIELVTSQARAQGAPSTCQQWEVQSFYLSDKDPNKRDDPHPMPFGWEPYGRAGWSIFLRRCAP